MYERFKANAQQCTALKFERIAPMIKSASEMLAAFIAAEIKQVEAIPMGVVSEFGK